MSRPEHKGDTYLSLSPRIRMGDYADFSRKVDHFKHLEFVKRVQELGLAFTDDEFIVIASLDHPDKVQKFLNKQIFYNDDHDTDEAVETAFSPRTMLREGKAHCFEGMLFAYMVNYLHGYNPKMVLLEASLD